jgi:hypothetical protein
MKRRACRQNLSDIDPGSAFAGAGSAGDEM